jgi:hyperosmotically inducible periplasmic protein
MGSFHRRLVGLIWVLASVSLGCTRASESATPGAAGRPGSVVGDDMRGVAKTTEKTAKDIGHAAVDLADKAGNGLEDATNKAGAGSQDAWITTKVKSALTSEGLDPLHVHVDTDGKVVTLSGSVDSAAKREKAVSLARAVTGVLGVKDHLFIKPDQR